MRRGTDIWRGAALAVFGLVGVSLFVGRAQTPKAVPGQTFRNMADDGAWCWFADPRAISGPGRSERIYAGWVDNRGSIWVGSLNTRTGQTVATNLRYQFEKDDHASPALLALPDGRIAVFYSAHGGTEDKGLRYRITARPDDISDWGDETLVGTNTGGPRGTCYPSPIRLAKENGRIYLFWRGGDFKPAVSWTDDLKTWADARTLIASDQDTSVRPYVKFDSNGSDRIHIAFTDGHPRNEPTNSIYYACYRKNAFAKADGRKIADMANLPIKHREADLVYDGRQTGIRAWIWDVAADDRNRPVIVYARLLREDDHRYHYARWNGRAWEDHELCAAGPWFPKTPAGKTEPEPHYSGGIVFDHADPSVVYVSRKVDDVFEIERWTTEDGGRRWRTEALTAHSARDNVRPVVVRNISRGQAPVLWMSNERYVHYTDFRAAIKISK